MKCRNCKNLRWAEEYPGKPFFGWCDAISDSPDMDIERECRCFEPATEEACKPVSMGEAPPTLERPKGWSPELEQKLKIRRKRRPERQSRRRDV